MPPIIAAAPFGVSYRLIVESDVPFLRELYASTRSEELAQTGWSDVLKSQFIAQQFHAQTIGYASAHPTMESLIVERAGVAIGRLLLDSDTGSFMVVDISLVPTMRGAGIGGAILGDVLQQAGRDSKTVVLSVLPTNPALRLYQRLGFSISDQSDPYYRMVRHSQNRV